MANNNSVTKPKYKNVIDDVPSEYIVDIKGTPAIKLGGLMFLAQQIGQYRIQTSCLRETANSVTFEAQVFLCPSDEYLQKAGISPNSPFIENLCRPTIAHATATDKNIKPMMLVYLHEMAETRSVARALRLATGCPYTAVEEIGDKNGVTVETLEDMMANEQKTAPKTDPFFSKPMPTQNVQTRAGLIPAIKEARDSNKGVKEFIVSYLDNHNAAVLENLSDAQLKEVFEKVKTLMNGE